MGPESWIAGRCEAIWCKVILSDTEVSSRPNLKVYGTVVIEHRKIRRLARRDCEPRRRPHRHHRHGEGMEGATVSKNPCTFVRP